MNITDAIDIMESISGVTDESTPVGDAWNVILRYIHNPTPPPVPLPDHVNLIGFAFGREPWATWLRQGGCLESAHCELSDLMLAVLARWGRPATPSSEPPADGEVAELVAWLRLESEDWRQANPGGHQGARLARAAELLERTATPPPEPPTDEELLAMRSWSSHSHTFDSDLVDFARAALERWGR